MGLKKSPDGRVFAHEDLDPHVFSDITDSKFFSVRDNDVFMGIRDAAKGNKKYAGPGATEEEVAESKLMNEMPEADWLRVAEDKGGKTHWMPFAPP